MYTTWHGHNTIKKITRHDKNWGTQIFCVIFMYMKTKKMKVSNVHTVYDSIHEIEYVILNYIINDILNIK